MRLNFLTKNLFNLFLVIFFIIGSYFAINTGITHDEFHDHLVFQANKNFFFNKFFETNFNTEYLSGLNRFYGSGFHYLSSIFELVTKKIYFIESHNNEAKIYLSKHISVFIFYLISGLAFKQIIKEVIENKLHVQLSTIFYLIYPYLFGHSLFNVKDIPFLSVWLICTFLFIKILKALFKKEKILKKHLVCLSISTAYLLSIRISGVLIFLHYLVFILVLLNQTNSNFFELLKKNFKEIIIFLSLTFILFIVLQPSYWNNPLLIFTGIRSMSQHIQTVCTITLGECMPAQNLPSTYLLIWFFFKLPLIIIFSLGLYFFVEKKLQKLKFNNLILISLFFSTLSILILLILFEVNLYDEIRQVMFLIPGIFIISLSILFFYSKKIFNISIVFFIIYFAIQNLKIFPYNYIWINNLSHISKIQNIFELDYWGVSTRNISSYFSLNNIDKSHCIISNRNNGLKLFLDKDQCFKSFDNIDKPNKRPFYVALMERKTRKGTPNNCKLLYEEFRYVNFSNEKVVFAKIFKCV